MLCGRLSVSRQTRHAELVPVTAIIIAVSNTSGTRVKKMSMPKWTERQKLTEKLLGSKALKTPKQTTTKHLQDARNSQGNSANYS